MKLTTKEISRFWTKVRVGAENECWPWMGTLFSSGYPAFSAQNQNRSGHRISYAINRGLIPEGLVVRHLCNNPKCVNPAHLAVGTQAENIADRDNAGRQARGERSGVSKMNPNSAATRAVLSEQKVGAKNPMSLLNPNSAELRRKLGEALRGKKHLNARRTRLKIVDQNGVVYSSSTEAARVLGIGQANISAVARGKRKSTHGYTFTLLEVTQ